MLTQLTEEQKVCVVLQFLPSYNGIVDMYHHFPKSPKHMLGPEGTLFKNVISYYYYRLPVFLLQLVIKERKVDLKHAFYQQMFIIDEYVEQKPHTLSAEMERGGLRKISLCKYCNVLIIVNISNV